MTKNMDLEKVFGIVNEIVNFNKMIIDEDSFSYVLKNLSCLIVRAETLRNSRSYWKEQVKYCCHFNQRTREKDE